MIWGFLVLVGGLFSVVNGDGQFDIFTRAQISVDGFVDTEACYSAMESSISDKDGDRKMNQEDYVNFVKAYGPKGFLKGITTFEELPLILQSTFYYIACLCKTDSNDESCCVGSNAGIDTSGSFSGEKPTVSEQSYLFLVCSQTSTSIDRVIQSTAPSDAPIATPIVSSVPTVLPTPDVSTPTVIGTLSPTRDPGNGTTTQEDVLVTYGIGIKGEAIFEDYSGGLISAMDSLAPEILQEVRRRQLRVGRRLQSVQLPTSITNHTVVGKYCMSKHISDGLCVSCVIAIRIFFSSHIIIFCYDMLYKSQQNVLQKSILLRIVVKILQPPLSYYSNRRSQTPAR
jgi:hypothetical protein